MLVHSKTTIYRTTRFFIFSFVQCDHLNTVTRRSPCSFICNPICRETNQLCREISFLCFSNMWNKLQIGCLTEMHAPKHNFKALVCFVVHNVMQHVFYSFNACKCIHNNKLSVIVVPFQMSRYFSYATKNAQISCTDWLANIMFTASNINRLNTSGFYILKQTFV